jgi:hypothetical protein
MTQLPMLRTSERGAFKRCTQRWWWGWREGLNTPGPPDVKLWFGQGFHLVLAHWYCGPGQKRGKEPLKVWRDWVGDEVVKIRVNIAGEDWKEEPYIEAGELGEKMLTNYFDLYGRDETWDVIQPERSSEVIIMDPSNTKPLVKYCFTYDLVYRDLKDDSIWLGEHKTAKAIMTGHLALDDQGGSYWAVATQELRHDGLIGPNENLKGIMYNFARKSPGDDRERNEHGQALNKDGSVSKNQPAKLFLREPVYRTRQERNSQIIRIQNEAAAMAKYRSGELKLTKTPTRDCSWDCSFYNMCILHERGSDWKEYKEMAYRSRDPYSDHRKSAAVAGD